MSAAKELLSKLKRPEKVVVPTVYFPPLFISIEAAIKMKEEDQIVATAKEMKIQPLPTSYIKSSMPPLPSISYEEYERQKKANEKLVDFIKSKKTTK